MKRYAPLYENAFLYQRLKEVSKVVYEKYPSLNKGGCGVFSKIIHDITGFPYMLIFNTDPDIQDPPIHVMIKLPDGALYDVEGIESKENVESRLSEGDELYFVEDDGEILNQYYDDLGEGTNCDSYIGEYNKIKDIVDKVYNA